jgi:hypothetical protein
LVFEAERLFLRQPPSLRGKDSRKVFFKMQVYILLVKNLSLVGADYEIEGVISNRDIVERWIANVLEDGPFARKFVTFELDDPYLLSILAQED